MAPALSNSEYNQRMGELVPELMNEYGHVPMNRDRWIKPGETAPDGQPAFIPYPKAANGEMNPVKDGYMWGPGTHGFGYYHLTTRAAYKALGARLRDESAPGPDCCGCFGGSGQDDSAGSKAELQQIMIIMYSRGESDRPVDSYAREFAAKSSGEAFRPPDDIGIWEMRLSANKN